MRLIDADALTDRIEADKKQDNISPGNFFLFKAYIMNAPTIEPDGDTISRRALMKRISEEYHKYGDDYDALQILGDIEDFPSAPSAEAEQVTGKLNNPDDSLLTADSGVRKEQKSKLDLISRQDAILAITGEPPEAHYPSWYAERIKALPSAETHDKRTETHGVCSELISRGDAIEAVRKVWYDNDNLKDFKQRYYEMGNNDAVEDAIGYIDALPSAPDSRQRGEWIPNHIPDSMLCECDQCGFDCVAYTFNFCPNCGARMYKGGEDE